MYTEIFKSGKAFLNEEMENIEANTCTWVVV